MTSVLSSQNCCGIREISGVWNIDGPKGVLKTVHSYFRGGGSCAIIMFSDAMAYGDGAKLSAIIKKHKLGLVVETGRVHNPNSGRAIKGWLWTVNKKALKAWYKKNNHES